MKRLHAGLAGTVAGTLLLTGCIGPMAPSPGMMPPPTSPAVMTDDLYCRQYADAQIAPLRNQANTNTIGSTLVGAGLGAALGGAIGDGRGAGIGAASGAIVGTGVGASNAQYAAAGLQQQYDAFYAQCMAARSPVPRGPAIGGPGLGVPAVPAPPGRYY